MSFKKGKIRASEGIIPIHVVVFTKPNKPKKKRGHDTIRQ